MRGTPIERSQSRQRGLDGTVAWPLMLHAALLLFGCVISRPLRGQNPRCCRRLRPRIHRLYVLHIHHRRWCRFRELPLPNTRSPPPPVHMPRGSEITSFSYLSCRFDLWMYLQTNQNGQNSPGDRVVP